MFRRLRHFIAHWRFHREMADLDRRDADARGRNCTRDIGALKKERYRRVNTALGWRGPAR